VIFHGLVGVDAGRSSMLGPLILAAFEPMTIVNFCDGMIRYYPRLCVFQPMRSHGRVIWKPREAPERVRDLVRPVSATAQGLELCLSCGEIVHLCRVYQIYLNSHILGIGRC
jgi:hypothetical protein